MPVQPVPAQAMPVLAMFEFMATTKSANTPREWARRCNALLTANSIHGRCRELGVTLRGLLAGADVVLVRDNRAFSQLYYRN